jgi:MFS family permease
VRSVLSLLIGTALLLSGSGLLATTLGIRLSSGGQSLGVAGVVVSAFSVGLVVGSWRAHRVIGRVGHIRAFAGFSGVAAAATLGISLVDSPLVWIVLRVLQGFVMGGNYLVIESWLGGSAEPAQRGRVLAAYIMTCQVALAVGQLLVTWGNFAGSLSLTALLFAVALVPVAWTRTAEPSLGEPARPGVLSVMRRAPVAVTGCFVSGCTVGSLLNLGAAFATSLGANVDQVAAFISSAVLGGLALQWPVGYLADRWERRLVIELIAVATVAGATALLWASTKPLASGTLALTGAAFALGASCFVLYPVSVAHAHDRVDRRDSVAVSATLVLAYGVGSATAPLALSGALELAGPRALPVGLAVFNACLALLAVVRLLRPIGVVSPRRTSFVPVALPQVAPRSQLESPE